MLILEQKITDFISTNLEQPYPIWDSTTEYPINTTVVYKNHVYRTIVDNNQSVQPDLNTGKWLLFGVDNAFASIDLNSSTSSIMDDGLDYIEFEFAVDRYNYLALSNIRGDAIEIWEYDELDVELAHIYHENELVRTCADTWFDYYYCGLPQENVPDCGYPFDYLHTPIHPLTKRMVVRIHKTVDDCASIGIMIGGRAVNIGETQFGVKVGLIDYSRKETDDYGITSIVRRKSRQTMRSVVMIRSQNTQLVKRIVRDTLGTVVMFIADPATDSNYENLLLLGYVEEFDLELINGVYTRGNLYTMEVL